MCLSERCCLLFIDLRGRWSVAAAVSVDTADDLVRCGVQYGTVGSVDQTISHNVLLIILFLLLNSVLFFYKCFFLFHLANGVQNFSVSHVIHVILFVGELDEVCFLFRVELSPNLFQLYVGGFFWDIKLVPRDGEVGGLEPLALDEILFSDDGVLFFLF